VDDGKTKNDHFRDMLRQAFEEKGIKRLYKNSIT
jgi:hypothetical protein